MLRKLRSHLDDIVLTSDDFHISHYETFLRENGLDVEIYVKQFMKSLVELIEMKDQNGNFLVIEEKHMREVLYKNFGESAGEQVLAGWNPNDPSFTVRLNEFNNRRERAYKGEYNTYLIDKYNNAYSA